MAKQHRPTTENREKVRMLASVGVPTHLIPHALDPNHPMDIATLYKYYDKDIKAGQAETARLVGQNLAQMAMGTGKEAMIAAMFYAKTQMGWREKETSLKIEPTQEFLTVLQKVNKGALIEDGSHGKGKVLEGTPASSPAVLECEESGD